MGVARAVRRVELALLTLRAGFRPALLLLARAPAGGESAEYCGGGELTTC